MIEFLMTLLFRLIGVVATAAVVYLILTMPARSGWDAAFSTLAIVLGVAEAIFGLFVDVTDRG